MFSFILSIVLVRIFQKIALKFNITDKPGGRKVHEKPKALLGGLAVYVSLFLTYSFYVKFSYTYEIIVILLLMFSLVLVGLYDDIKDLKAIQKLFFQLIISLGTSFVMGGIQRIEIYGNILNFTQIQGVIIQTIWLVALINAINLIDGLDGLSSGVGIISFSSLLILSLMGNDITTITIILIILGTLLGFLYYNFYPSTIFLGDSGSMLIGYLIGVISMESYKTFTLTSMLLLLLISFMPFLDVILAIIRRKISKRKAFEADSLHFHHRLLLKGYSHPVAVLIMYGLMLIYTIIAIILDISNSLISKIILTVLLLIFTLLIFEKLYLLSDKYALITKNIKRLRNKLK